MIGGRLAEATFEPELVMTDGEALLVENIIPVGVDRPDEGRRGVEPVPHDVRRRVVGPPPRDDGRAARSTSSATRTSRSSATRRSPKAQLLGMRGAPGNTINDTSPATGSRATRRGCSSPKVDVVSRRRLRPRRRARRLGAARFHELRARRHQPRVLDFETPDHRMRLRRVHPGVTVDDVVAATGFELAIADDVPETRLPTDDELRR